MQASPGVSVTPILSYLYYSVYLLYQYKSTNTDTCGAEAGIAWCFGHADTAFPERAIFGSIRSMTASGLEKKFEKASVHRYVKRINDLRRYSDYLLHWYKSTNTDAAARITELRRELKGNLLPGAQFTCCTSTKVQILTHQYLATPPAPPPRLSKQVARTLAASVASVYELPRTLVTMVNELHQ